MKKKILALCLSLIIIVGLFGCTSNQTQQNQQEASGGNQMGSSENKKQEEANKDVPEKVIEISVELFDRNKVPQEEGTLENNRWTKWIKEEMLKEGVKVNFFPVPRSEETSKLNVLMASGSAPDIIFTYDRFLFSKYALEGGLHDFGGLIDQYGPDVKKVFGKEDILEYGVIDGKQYAIPARRANPNHKVSFIRKDWLDVLGMDIPTNRDELVEVLKAFKEQDPGKMGQDKVVPWGNVDNVSSNFEPHGFMLYNAMYSFFDHSIEKMYTTPNPLREGFKEFMEWMNILYSEDLIDKEFATQTGEIKRQKVNIGEVGFFIEGWWVPSDPNGIEYRILKENVPTAELVPLEVFQNGDGKYYKTQYPPVGFYIMSPKTCKNPEGAVKYLNWMAKEDVSWTMSFGMEGEHYDLKNGIPVVKDIDYNNKTMNYIMSDLKLLFNGNHPMPQDTERELLKIKYGDLGEFAVASSDMSGRDAVPEILFNKQIEAETKYLPELSKTYDEYWIKLIMTEDFQSTWEEFQKEIKTRGIEEIQKERTAYYNEFVK